MCYRIFILATTGCSFFPQLLSADEQVDYLRQIKPLLSKSCYSCHGPLKQEGNLRLDAAGLIKKGGESGPAIVAGKSDESLLFEYITGSDDFRMPPAKDGNKLDADKIALIKSWIDQGAGAPRDEQPLPLPEEHWAFKTPVRPEIPTVAAADWSSNPIDAFIKVRQEVLGLVAQPTASKEVLLRRVYLDLIGLPPTRDELKTFLADDSAKAYEEVVERLLTSPLYGQRWGRHWMDVWRYSDWYGLNGKDIINSRKHIWQWRDWIIESLNEDKAYDRMVLEMLAADELLAGDPQALRATGYLARSYYHFDRNVQIQNTLEHAGKALLGLTMECSRCHDHKYDPISQRDYYRMRAFFDPLGV